MSEAEAAPISRDLDRNSHAVRRAGLARPGNATLIVVLSGAFMVVLDFFIVMVTLPSISAGLGATGAQLQLVVTGYGVANAVGLITGGRLGDRYGRRRMFSLGLLAFTLTSAACGLATSPSMLIAMRIAQGLSGALLQPQVLAILGVAYRGHARTRAFSAYAVAMGSAGVIGQLLGGALLHADLESMGWRACFLINVPVGIIALVLTPRVVPMLRSRGVSRVDGIGMMLVGLLLAALIAPLIEGRQQGWPAWSLVLLAAVPSLGSLLLWQQRRLASRQGHPLISPSLLRRPLFASALCATLLFYAGTASFYFVLALYLQQGLGMAPLASGAMFAVFGIGFFLTSTLVRPISALFGGRHLTVGAWLLACAHALQAVLVLSLDLHWAALVPVLLAQGAGLGMVMAPLTSTALAGVPPSQAGLASGVLATVQQVGNSIGVALIGLMFYGALDPNSAPAPSSAFAASLLYLVVLCVALALVLQRRTRAAAQARKLTRPPAA